MIKEEKKIMVIFISILIILLIVSFVSANWFDDLKKALTGKATNPVVINISVGGPTITQVWNYTLTSITPTEAPGITNIIINFTAYSPSGSGNLNYSTAVANISKTDETTRENSTCTLTETTATTANYTCNITMRWWDASGTWNIQTYIEDNQTNVAKNNSAVFYLGSRTSFNMGPSTLSWANLAPGATNQTSSNDALKLNNTGNKVIAVDNIQINSSNLRGEVTTTEALWAKNFSVDWQTGGTCSGADCTECAGTAMNNNTYIGVVGANLSAGNFTIDDGNTGQEQLYFCLRIIGTDISSQAYSTSNEWNWVIQAS